MATTTTLTPKQQQVKDLLDQGKTPTEVAKKLKVNVNSVYQHIRRMNGGAAAKPKRTAARKSTAKAGAKRTTARKSTARKRPSRSRPAPAAATPVAEARAMTPLQAIRHRKSEIESQLAESTRRVLEAAKAHNSEKESHAKLEANRADELKQLIAAEAALTGKSTAKPRSRSGAKSNNGTKAAAAPAAAPAATPEPQSAGTAAPEPDPTPVEADGTTGSTTEAPEPVEPPTGDEALAAVGAEERPGVETLPEFTQEGEGDAFAGE